MTAAAAHQQATRRRMSRWAMAVAGLTVVFVAVYSIFMLIAYARFHVHAFDFAIFDQGLWLLSRFDEPFVTVRGLHLFADHSSYILLLLTPLYWVLPAQQVLIVLTVAVLGAGAPLGYALARSRGATELVAATVAVVYLLHPALAWAAKDGFHPEYFVIPLVITAALLVEKEHEWWAVAAVAVAALAKEDAALVLVPFGLYVALGRRRRAAGLTMAAVAAGAMLLSFAVLLPHFSPTGEVLYSDRYDDLGQGLAGIASGMVTKPQVVLGALLEPRSIGYVAALLLPMPLALLAPRVLLIGAPTLLANVLSDHTYQSSIRYHYTAYLLAALLLAAAAAAPRLGGLTPRMRGTAVAVSLIAAVVAQIALAPNPLAAPEQWPADSSDHATIRSGLALIPAEAVVSAFDTFVPHLAHRTTVYEFPNPWRRFNYGPQNAELPDPSTVEWVVVRTDVYPEMQELISTLRASGEFRVAYDQPPVLVLQRGP